VAGLIGGSYLLYKELKAQKELKELHAGDPCYECEDDCSDCPEAFFEEDDELNCAFVDDDDKVQELIVEEEA
ncbi:MAG TPA: hypothetical protein DCY75_02390, partial [Clostridiales bacterium]|nr:hypothetical protein [Clostridiales bacterium]